MGLNEQSIEALRELLKSGEITTTDIVRDIDAAIESDKRDDLPLNAYIRFDRAEIDRRVDKSEREKIKGLPSRDLLRGIPIGVKDLINVLGSPTTCGSEILKEYVSPYDATAIINLERSGGIPAGKLNMDEFAMGSSTESSAFGPVRNPHDRRKIPGGSSGGSAAAVAGGLAVAALGSDTGGSIRQPASMCGVFGMKPTYGRVSRYGLVAYASSFDQIGPVTRTVMDGAILLEAIAGFDPADSTSAKVETPRFSELVNGGAKGLRVGVPDEYFGEGLSDEVRALVERGISLLAKAGAVTKKISLKYTRYAIATYYIIATAEA